MKHDVDAGRLALLETLVQVVLEELEGVVGEAARLPLVHEVERLRVGDEDADPPAAGFDHAVEVALPRVLGVLLEGRGRRRFLRGGARGESQKNSGGDEPDETDAD